MHMDENKKVLAEFFLNAVAAGLEGKTIETADFSMEDWEMLMGLSIEQSLLPVVFDAVYLSMPPVLEEKYRKVSLAWISRQLRDTQQFLEMYSRLSALGIYPMVIKGILCRNTYACPDWRVSSDEDIYIRRSEYLPFHQAMLDMGFEAQQPNFDSNHELTYKRKSLRIEGHWELFPHKSIQWEHMNMLTEDIRSRARFIEIEGVRIFMPEPTDHMIYLIMHAMKHFNLSGVGIRQICDIVQWDKYYTIDWKRVKEVVTPLGGSIFTAAVLDAGYRYFGMEIPDGWDPVNSENLINDALQGGVFGHSTQDRLHSALITSSDGPGHSVSYNILRTIFPPRKSLEINFPWASRSRLLLPAAWFARVFRYIGSVEKGTSPFKSIQIGKNRIKLMEEYDIFRVSDK